MAECEKSSLSRLLSLLTWTFRLQSILLLTLCSNLKMRFLNTQTLRFEQIPESELHLERNQYAILSHRWGADEDEISYEDVQSSANFTNKKGYHKIEGFCKVASAQNCRYGWVDTCCINNANYTELNEAINSMYQWYQDSKICITYLEDVPQKQWTDSSWFERGWTLQELIGPKP